MPVTVKFQTEVLVCGLQGRLFPSFDVGPMFPCSKNATQCRKEICSTCYVWGIHCRYSLLQRHSTHEDIRKSARVDYWVANPAPKSPGSVLELWISDQWWIRIIFRCTFSVPKICPPSFQATHACHSEVSNRSFGLWSPRPFVSIFRSRPHVSMFEKCDAVPKGDLFDMLRLRNPLPLFFIAKTFNSWRHQKVGKGGLLSCESSSKIARVGAWVVNQWSVMDSKYFSLYIFCTQNLSSLVPSNSCLSQWSSNQKFWLVVSKAICFHLSMSAPCFHVRKMWLSAERRFVRHVCLRNPCLLWNLSLHSLPEAWGPWERQHAPPAHYGCVMLAKDIKR